MRQLFPIITLIVALTLGSCDSHSPLRAELAEARRATPLTLGIFGNISAVEYNDTDNIVTVAISPAELVADSLSLQSLYTELSPGFPLLMVREQLPSLLDRTVDECASLVITIAGQPLDTIHPSTLEQALADSTATLTPHERALELLGLAIAAERRSLPSTPPQPEPARGAVTAGCRLEGNTVVYDIVIDSLSWTNSSFTDSCAVIITRDLLPVSANRDGLLRYIVDARRSLTLRFTPYPSSSLSGTALTFSPDSLADMIK